MNKKLKKFILYLPLLLSILLIIYSLNYIFLWISDRNKTNKLKTNLKEISNVRDINFDNYSLINPPQDKNDSYYKYIDEKFLKVDFYELLKQNEDTVGWIFVNGTEVNYPIVKSNNNNFYLNHSFDKTENKSGWIFLDYRNDLDNLSFNTILYGHGRADYTMFGSLREVLKEDWFNEKRNRTISKS